MTANKEVSRVVDIQTISIAVASASVVAGVTYYALQLRNQSKIREMDAIVRINPSFSVSLIEWQQAAFKVGNLQFKDYDDFVKKYGSFATETPTIMAIHAICNFYEGIGYLLERRLVSIDYVWNVYGDAIVLLWEKLKPVVEGVRKEFNVPRIWKPFEHLYNEMKKREQQQASKTA